MNELRKARLKKINAELKKHGVLEITPTLSESVLTELLETAKQSKKEIASKSEHNTYHKSSDYACALLVQEAVEIITSPDFESPIVTYISESSMNDLETLRKTYSKYVSKHGEDAKAQSLKESISKIERKIYESKKTKLLQSVIVESAGAAETIMSAKGLHDDMIDLQVKVGDIQNKYVDSFIGMVNDEFGIDKADSIKSQLMDSLDALMAAVRQTKDDVLSIVNQLSGNTDIGSAESFEADTEEDFDTEIGFDRKDDKEELSVDFEDEEVSEETPKEVEKEFERKD